MVKSSFSGKEIPPGTGIMYVKKDGKILYFLNRKEEKNMLKLGRKARKTAWTEDYRKEKGQRIAVAQHAAEHAHQDEAPTKKAPAKKAATKKATSKSESPKLTALDGVGPKTAKALKAAGFDTVADIAGADVNELSEVDGVGEATAKDLIAKAKEMQ